MWSSRRAAAAALLLAALLLLLLARLPPARPPPPARVLRPDAAPAASTVQVVRSVASVASVESAMIVAAAADSAAPRVAPTRVSVSSSVASTASRVPPTASRARPTSSPAPSVNLTAGAGTVGARYEAGFESAHASLCGRLGARVRVLVLVTSAPAHAPARAAVRYTWGSFARRADVAIAFMLGRPPPALKQAVADEDALYGDLIVGRFVDSYQNLTLKTLAMLEWTSSYCPGAGFLLKTDDDMFINVPRLLQFAEKHANKTLTVWGRVIARTLPNRGAKSKYFVAKSEFPGRVFPPFATGPAYLVSADAVRPLAAATAAARWLHLEDVLVTGLAATAARVARVHAPEFHNRRATQPCAPQRLLALHMVRYHEQFELWRRLMDTRTKC